MGVYIKGMKMPKDCTECRFAFDGRCLANWGRKSKIDVTNYCPLIELPAEHGRLIDADAPIVLTDARGRKIEVTVSHIIERNGGEIVSVIEAEEVSE